MYLGKLWGFTILTVMILPVSTWVAETKFKRRKKIKSGLKIDNWRTRRKEKKNQFDEPIYISPKEPLQILQPNLYFYATFLSIPKSQKLIGSAEPKRTKLGFNQIWGLIQSRRNLSSFSIFDQFFVFLQNSLYSLQLLFRFDRWERKRERGRERERENQKQAK